MSQFLELYDYWESYKKGNPDNELANQIKYKLENHGLHVMSALTFVCYIASEDGYSDKSIVDASEVYKNIGLEEVEECNLPKEIFKEFLTVASKFNLDGTQTLVNASAIWDVFKDVDDENPIKKSVLHFVADNIISFGIYNDLEIVNFYLNYVRNHNDRVLTVPVEIARLLY